MKVHARYMQNLLCRKATTWDNMRDFQIWKPSCTDWTHYGIHSKTVLHNGWFRNRMAVDQAALHTCTIQCIECTSELATVTCLATVDRAWRKTEREVKKSERGLREYNMNRNFTIQTKIHNSTYMQINQH